MTGISANAARAPGRAGACAALNTAEAATSPWTASRGANAASPRAARRIASTAHSPAAPSRAKNSRYGHGPASRMLSRAKPVSPRAEIPAATAANPNSSPCCTTAAASSRPRARDPLTGHPASGGR